MNASDKTSLFLRIVRGADDVFATRSADVEIRDDGSRDRQERWRPVWVPLDESAARRHLLGLTEVGTYALIPASDAPLVRWIAADFDGKRPGTNWKADVQRLVTWMIDSGVVPFVNLSRSADGAHVRVLFDEPVPAWIARRWMTWWIDEADVGTASSFDRLIPPQDTLDSRAPKRGPRALGNLIGAPLHKGHAKRRGGSLPLDPYEVASGDFEPDGKHWEHVVTALDHDDKPTVASMVALVGDKRPAELAAGPRQFGGHTLPVLAGDDAKLDFVLSHCEFFRFMRQPGEQSYAMWIAAATQLQRYGEAGRRAFHEISSFDHRYRSDETERKWSQTSGMTPIRCDTIATQGFVCPHLGGPRCNGAKCPSFFADYLGYEPL